MKTNAVSHSMDSLDAVRQELCREFARSLHSGALQVRVRLHPQAGEAWFYEHRDNQWHKRDVVIRDPQLLAAVTEQLELLASKPQGDALKVTVHDSADWHDTDLTFRVDSVQPHLDRELESHLMGLLFRDHHDSGKDVRRHIQNGPRRAGRGH